MNPPNKRSSPDVKGVQPLKHQARLPHQFKPVVVQAKRAPAMADVKRPVAPPPAYRPSPKPQIVQQKNTATPQLRTPPPAPPAYRPQPLARVLQTKMHAPQQPLSRPQSAPSAPPVYRPQAVPKVLQMKSKLAAPTRQSNPSPIRGAARGIASRTLRKASGAIQLSAAPAPTPAPVPVVVAAAAPAPVPAVPAQAPAVVTKSEAEVQKAIDAQFVLWATDVKGGYDVSRGWNTGFNGPGGKNENVTKADYDKLCAWWTKKVAKVKVPFSITVSNQKIEFTVEKAVTYRSAVSSQWDMKSKDALCDFLAQVGDKGGFNFHINVIGRF